LKAKFFKFLLGILIVLIFTSSSNSFRNYPKNPVCAARFIFTNESGSTTIAQITASDSYQDYIIYNLGPGQVDTIDVLGPTAAGVCIRIGTSHPAGRIKFFDTNGTLVSCINIAANSNNAICYDIDPLIFCTPYNFYFKDVSCPN